MSRPLLVATLLLAVFQAGAGSGEAAWQALRPGETLKRDFKASSPHLYGLDLEAGQYIRLRVAQRGVDVHVVVTSPEGRKLLDVESPPDLYGSETVPLVADTAGLYTFDVQPRRRALLDRGGYEISVEGPPRQATSEDRLRAEAGRVRAEAYAQLSQERPETLAEALRGYERVLAIAKQLGDAGLEAAVRYQSGLAFLLGKQFPPARAAFEQALAGWRQLNVPRECAISLNQIGRTCRYLGDSPCAVAAFQEGIEILEGIGELDTASTLMVNLARLDVDLGDLPSAIGLYQKSLEIDRIYKDEAGEAFDLNALGNVYDQQGRPLDALSHFENASSMARRAGNFNILGDSLRNAGDLYKRLGQPQKALESLIPALESYEKGTDLARRANLLASLGSLLNDLGEPAEGRDLLLQALPLLRDPREGARLRLTLGRIAMAEGDYDAAAKSVSEAIATVQQMKDPAGEAQALQARGFLYLKQGEAARAKEDLAQALSGLETIGILAERPEILRGLGQATVALGDPAAGERFFEQGVSLAKELGDSAEEARILEAMARSKRDRGELPAARRDLEQAIARLESLRSEISGDHLRASSFAAQRDAYELYVDVLGQIHRSAPTGGLDTEAFEAAERARARGMLDFLSRARVDLREGDPVLLKEEERLRLEMNAKSALRAERLRKPDRAREVEALDRELSSLEAQYQIVEARLDAKNPDYSKLKRPQVRLAEVQSSLDGDTALLEYFLAEPRSYLWLVTPDSFASFELPGRARIEELARTVHEQLGTLTPQNGSDRRRNLEELSRILLGPVAGRLKARRLAIVPDGALLYLPFSVLPVSAFKEAGTVPLIVEHEVVHLPSAAVVREIRRSREGHPGPRSALALLADPVFERTDPRLQTATAGMPPGTDGVTRDAGTEPTPPLTTGDLWSDFLGLPRQGGGTSFARLAWTRHEAEAIAAEARGREVLLALDFRANRDLATSGSLGGYRIVHFATHGVLDTRHPALSGLVFSQVNESGRLQDGFLRLHDIYRLHLNADLIVLSGCETALGKSLRGEGIMGLTRGFFHAGASQVLASLWPVRDRATAELMQRFYRGMFRDGLPASAALRQAQLSLWKDRAWRDPYFWAGFVLQGDWRAGGL